MRYLFLIWALAMAWMGGVRASAFSLEEAGSLEPPSRLQSGALVVIGDPGNSADPATGYGSVGYSYQIMSEEVTIAEFSAARAGDARISNGNEDYWNDGTRTVGASAPASQVSLYEAMKYCNFLTSGDAYQGAYLFDGGGLYQGTDRGAAIATYGSIVALPTENEWYKAAYYTGDPADPWSLFANGEDNDLAPGAGPGQWNFDSVLPGPNFMWATDSGATEQNGTLNMMGNVFEWVEHPEGVVRGSSFLGNLAWLRSTYRWNTHDPGGESVTTGFRVVVTQAVPEPATVGLLIGGGLVLCVRRRGVLRFRAK